MIMANSGVIIRKHCFAELLSSTFLMTKYIVVEKKRYLWTKTCVCIRTRLYSLIVFRKMVKLFANSLIIFRKMIKLFMDSLIKISIIIKTNLYLLIKTCVAVKKRFSSLTKKRILLSHHLYFA